MRESPKHRAAGRCSPKRFGLTDSRHPLHLRLRRRALSRISRSTKWSAAAAAFIVVVDGGQDPECQFEDLSNAIRKIRSDLGVWIDLDKCANQENGSKDKSPDARCAMTGIIHYGEKDAPAGASDDEKNKFQRAC